MPPTQFHKHKGMFYVLVYLYAEQLAALVATYSMQKIVRFLYDNTLSNALAFAGRTQEKKMYYQLIINQKYSFTDCSKTTRFSDSDTVLA